MGFVGLEDKGNGCLKMCYLNYMLEYIDIFQIIIYTVLYDLLCYFANDNQNE